MTIDALTRPYIVPLHKTLDQPVFSTAAVDPAAPAPIPNPVANAKKLLDKMQALRTFVHTSPYCGECDPPGYISDAGYWKVSDQAEYDRLDRLVFGGGEQRLLGNDGLIPSTIMGLFSANGVSEGDFRSISNVGFDRYGINFPNKLYIKEGELFYAIGIECDISERVNIVSEAEYKKALVKQGEFFADMQRAVRDLHKPPQTVTLEQPKPSGQSIFAQQEQQRQEQARAAEAERQRQAAEAARKKAEEEAKKKKEVDPDALPVRPRPGKPWPIDY